MHCSFPLHSEAKLSFELFFKSWERKTGVKLEGRLSSLLPRRLVPSIFPITHEVVAGVGLQLYFCSVHPLLSLYMACSGGGRHGRTG